MRSTHKIFVLKRDNALTINVDLITYTKEQRLFFLPQKMTVIIHRFLFTHLAEEHWLQEP